MRKATLAFCAIVGLSASMAGPASAKVEVVPYSKSGDWSIKAIYRSDGGFSHCSAAARYQNGTRVSIIVYANTNWRLWFSHASWPNRPKSSFPSTLRVDGRVVLNHPGYFIGRNAYVNLGTNVARVKALMGGLQMAISTPAGTSRFSLKGTKNATIEAARCWKANYSRRGGGGAFAAGGGSGTGGAFGGAATAPSGYRELSRAQTLEIATQYLSKARQSYAILPRSKSLLRHFPVNWRYQDGSFGGMRVISNSSVSVERLLGSLLSGQAKNCKGRNASQRAPIKWIKGNQLASARGVCETGNGNVLTVFYKVAELGRKITMMVVEVRSGGKAGAPQRPKSGRLGKDDAI